MNRKTRLPDVVAFAFSVALGVAAFAGLAAWAYSQLDSIDQQIVATSGIGNGTLFIRTTNSGDDHAKP